MSNNQLPADVQERIKADAEAKYPLNISHEGPQTSYIAGATAERERVKVLVDALTKIANPMKELDENGIYMKIVATEALSKWKGEVGQ